jgi:hypothetical protein
MTERRTLTQHGSSLVEAALLIPLLVASVYGSLCLADLGLAQLWPQEIARHAAFAVASRPLSSFEASALTQVEHDAAFERARRAVTWELQARYRDLDGARERVAHSAGELQTLTATLDGVTITNGVPGPVPRELDALESHGALDAVLQLLGLDVRPAGFVGRAARAIGLDGRGLVRASAVVSVNAAAGEGAMMPGTEAASMVLVADPWRVLDGATAEPTGPDAAAPSTNPSFGNAVTALDQRIAGAWPVGPLVSRLLDLNPPALPAGVSNVFGLPTFAPAAHLVSRPYAAGRGERPGWPRGEQPGQVDIFALTHARAEPGATTTFETLPLDTAALGRRGRWFLGCPLAEQRECRR